MILVDANLLLYASNHSAPEHELARAWLDGQLSGTARVGLPWPSLLAFVRLASNPVIVRDAVSRLRPGDRSRNGSQARAPGCRCPEHAIRRFWAI